MSPPPRKKTKKDEKAATAQPGDSHSGVIRIEIDNVSAMVDGDYRFSSEIEVGGIVWRAKFYKEVFGEFGPYLHASLNCMHNQSSTWSVDWKADFVVINSDASKNISEEETGTYGKNSNSCCYVPLLDWDKLMNALRFIENDKLAVEVRFSVSNMRNIRAQPRFDFTDTNEPSHDVALIIEGEKVYASKQILASHSPVFKAMFYGNFDEKGRKEIELKELDRQEFIEMLHVIYPSCKMIAEDSAEYLLKIGDQFQITHLIDRVEKFLCTRRVGVSFAEKLRIADKYRLAGLMEHCMSDFKHRGVFEHVKDSPVYDQLSAETIKALFEKLLQVAKQSFPVYM